MSYTSSVIVWVVKSIQKFKNYRDLIKNHLAEVIKTSMLTNCATCKEQKPGLAHNKSSNKLLLLCNCISFISGISPCFWRSNFHITNWLISVFYSSNDGILFSTEAITRKTILCWNTFWMKIRFLFVGKANEGEKKPLTTVISLDASYLFYGFNIFLFFWEKTISTIIKLFTSVDAIKIEYKPHE